VRSLADKVLLGRLAAAPSIMGICETDLAPLAAGQPGSGTVAVHVWNGADFVASDPAMAFTGYNASTSKIKAGTLVQFVASGGLWIVASAGAADTTAVVRVYSADADAETCLWPGKLVAPGEGIEDACANPFEDQEDCWLLALNSTGGSWAADKMTLTVDEHYVGKHVFSIEDVPVYAIRVAPRSVRIFRATLSGTLARSDTTGNVANVESLTADAPPEIETVSNPLQLAGLNGDDCFFVEDASGTSPVYYFLNIEHHDCP
jgi:hypothetical protein